MIFLENGCQEIGEYVGVIFVSANPFIDSTQNANSELTPYTKYTQSVPQTKYTQSVPQIKYTLSK